MWRHQRRGAALFGLGLGGAGLAGGARLGCCCGKLRDSIGYTQFTHIIMVVHHLLRDLPARRLEERPAWLIHHLQRLLVDLSSRPVSARRVGRWTWYTRSGGRRRLRHCGRCRAGTRDMEPIPVNRPMKRGSFLAQPDPSPGMESDWMKGELTWFGRESPCIFPLYGRCTPTLADPRPERPVCWRWTGRGHRSCNDGSAAQFNALPAA